MDRRLLPDLVAARRSGQLLAVVVANHVQRMKANPNPIDRAALFSLTRWLARHGVAA